MKAINQIQFWVLSQGAGWRGGTRRRTQDIHVIRCCFWYGQVQVTQVFEVLCSVQAQHNGHEPHFVYNGHLPQLEHAQTCEECVNWCCSLCSLASQPHNQQSMYLFWLPHLTYVHIYEHWGYNSECAWSDRWLTMRFVAVRTMQEYQATSKYLERWNVHCQYKHHLCQPDSCLVPETPNEAPSRREVDHRSVKCESFSVTFLCQTVEYFLSNNRPIWARVGNSNLEYAEA